MPSCSLISLRLTAFGLRSAAKIDSRIASCSGLTRDRFLRSLPLAAGSVARSGKLLRDEDVSGDDTGEGVLEVGVARVVTCVAGDSLPLRDGEDGD